MSPVLPIIGSVLVVSAASLAGVVLLSSSLLQRALFWLVSFATGAILGNVFFHLLPEMLEENPQPELSFMLIFVGILISFVLEKFIHWHHCHHVECAEHTHPVGTIALVGDGVHNFIDGVLIASAYMVDLDLGLATTIAVLLHEIPQEIGDFAILLHSGFSRMKALLWNALSAGTALLGAFFVIALDMSFEGLALILLPLTVGNFLYIALADLVPELHRESRPSRAILQLICVVAGASMLFALSYSETDHMHAGEAELHEDQEEVESSSL